MNYSNDDDLEYLISDDDDDDEEEEEEEEEEEDEDGEYITEFQYRLLIACACMIPVLILVEILTR